MKVFLDDKRQPPDDSWQLVRSAKKCKTVVKGRFSK